MGDARGGGSGERAKKSATRRTNAKERDKAANNGSRKDTDDRARNLKPTLATETGDKREQAARGKKSARDAMRETDGTTTGETTRREPGERNRPQSERAGDRTEQNDNAEGTANDTLHDSAVPEQGEAETQPTDTTGAPGRPVDTTTGDRSRRPRADTDGVQVHWKSGRNHPVIGLTGPMCAGKNVAGSILEERGFAVVDADKVAHAALVDVQTKVIAEFQDLAAGRGIALVAADGSLDRRALGSLVFSDPDLLARHESIVYPRINELLDNYIEENPDRPVVINAPLLHKSPVLDRCDFVIFVDAWVPVRLFRARNRDKLPFSQIFARFSAQKHLFAQYLLKDVDIQRVWNHGNAKVLARKLMKLLFFRGY